MSQNPELKNLVLTRDIDESVFIDGPCQVTVIRTGSKGARLLFTAPPTTKIVRKEIADVGSLWGGKK
jgi:carbon storage regulator CsrA